MVKTMNDKEFQKYRSQITSLLEGSAMKEEEIVSALEALVNDQRTQSTDANDLVAAHRRLYVLAVATLSTKPYNNLYDVLRNHPNASQLFSGIAKIWAVEAAAAQSHYTMEDESFNKDAPRGYFPATPYEQWFITRSGREEGGLPTKEKREKRREQYLHYCEKREAEYKRRSQ